MPSTMIRLMTVVMAACALLLSGCASIDAQPSLSGDGTVVRIGERTQAGRTGSVVGAIGGAVVGSVIGGQFGGGFGQTVAATAGAVGGSMAGSQIGARAGAQLVWDVTIRFEDGIERTLTVADRPAVRPGDRVTVRDGQIARR